jgi:hypothetical protein
MLDSLGPPSSMIVIHLLSNSRASNRQIAIPSGDLPTIGELAVPNDEHFAVQRRRRTNVSGDRQQFVTRLEVVCSNCLQDEMLFILQHGFCVRNIGEEEPIASRWIGGDGLVT